MSSCSGCFKKFNFLRRENPCSKCSLRFCSKCLIVADSSSTFVCKLCQKNKNFPFDDQLSKPIAQSNENLSTDFAADMSDKDLISDLKERLDKLRENEHIKTDSSSAVSDVETRLMNLRGVSGTVSNQSESDWLLNPKPKRSQQQEIDNLLNAAYDEQKIGCKVLSPEEEIAQRLAKLRGEEILPKSDDHKNPINIDEIRSANEKIKRSVYKNQRPSDFEAVEPSFEQIDQLIRDEAEKAQKAARLSLRNEQIQLIMQQYAEQAKNHPADQKDEDQIDEDQLIDVIKQVLLTPDEETEIENM